MKIKWYGILLIVLAVVFGAAPASWSSEPIHIALSAPMTGNYAEYGQNFQRAIAIAVEWSNAAGEIKGRPIVIVAGDSKGDPKEAAALAQKFTSDNQIVAEIGDFTSTACMAAQPIYDQAGMVQLSPTSSHPDFAPKSPWSFGIVGTQAGEGPFMLFSPKLLEIGGSAVEGLHTSTIFFDKDPQPDVEKFVKAFEAKHNVTPNMFAAVAFDSLNILAEAIRRAGTDRKAIRDELAKTKDFPGLTGKITFTERRDVIKDYRYLIVKNGQWALFDK